MHGKLPNRHRVIYLCAAGRWSSAKAARQNRPLRMRLAKNSPSAKKRTLQKHHATARARDQLIRLEKCQD